MLEKVQQRAIKRAPGLSRKSYDKILNILDLTLEERQMRGDLNQQYKIVYKKHTV
jgi:hypothetical protein